MKRCRKHSPAARVFYISFVLSDARRVLSQCNERTRLLSLLNKFKFDQTHFVLAVSLLFSLGVFNLIFQVGAVELQDLEFQ